jgi:hypothetical protein
MGIKEFYDEHATLINVAVVVIVILAIGPRVWKWLKEQTTGMMTY